jgi:hypothetical protein
MKERNKDPHQADNIPKAPPVEETDKEVQREKAEVKEVAGRHKNDGQNGHKGRR